MTNEPTTTPAETSQAITEALHQVRTERAGVRWSDEQLAIFEWFRHGTGNLVVEAYAGTGKTTTIIEGIQGAPEQRILLCAFNKRIQEELAKKLRNPNAEAKTLHGVGFACVRRFWEGLRVASGNSRELALAEHVCDGRTPDSIKRLIGKLCTKGRELAPHATQAGDLVGLAMEYDLLPEADFEDAGFGLDYVEHRALEAMELAASVKPREIDFADMLYLPVRNHWLTKTYDLVVVDEAQDMNVTQLEIAQGVCKGRMVVVGDPNQAIYAFRGADSNSLARLGLELQATKLHLTTTYRCPKLVVAYAARLVPGYQAAPEAPEGLITSCPTLEALCALAKAEADEDGKPHDFILSRTNAPLAHVAMGLIRLQVRVRIQGRDIGAGLISLVGKLAKGKAANSIPAFLERLAKWEEREVLRAEAANRDDLVSAIHDKADTLVVVAEGTSGPKELQARLQALFADEGSAASVVCSSVHKAKGLEARRVFVLRPTLYPRPRKGQVQTPLQVREEQNIEYVAVTRSQAELVWVEAK
jgi:superfamily I DNA/RNA helicase